MSGDGLMDVEALLRRTLGRLFERTLGQEWQQRLSRRAARALEAAQERARQSRDGVPSDPWLASGLTEIRKVAEHFLSQLDDEAIDFSDTDPDGRLRRGLDDLGWSSVELCRADIERISPSRHGEAHPNVVPPLASATKDEVAAITKRLRLGCEKIRRDLLQLDEDWFPYIESVTCPGVDEWQYERGRSDSRLALLNEGDSLEFIVRAMNTEDSDTRLHFGLSVQADGGTFVTVTENATGGRLKCEATPPGRNVMFRVSVRHHAGGHDASGWDDHVVLRATIRPVPSVR